MNETEASVPMKWTAFIVLGTVALGLAMPLAQNSLFKFVLFFYALILYTGSMISMISIAHVYNDRAKSFMGLVNLYVDVILLFSSAYFFASVIDSKATIIFGVTEVCSQLSCYGGLLAQGESLIKALIDSTYLSILVMTTSSDTSIGVGNGWGRWLVAVQLCITVFITVVGLSSYFSAETAKQLRTMEARLLSAIKSENGTLPKSENKKNGFWSKVVRFFA